MKVAFYRRIPDGTIVHHNIAKHLDGFDEEEVREVVESFNRSNFTAGRTVEIIEVEPGSFIEYLLHKCDAAVTYTRDSIEDALTAIRGAEEAILSLKPAEEG